MLINIERLFIICWPFQERKRLQLIKYHKIKKSVHFGERFL
jgi:hypothetical protein